MSKSKEETTVDLAAAEEFRTLYWRLLDMESHASIVGDISVLLDRIFDTSVTPNVTLLRIGDDVSSLVDDTPFLSAKAVFDRVAQEDMDRRHFILWQFSPLIRIEGSHLSGSIQLRDAATESGAHLLRLHSRLSGHGDLNNSVAFSFSQDMAFEGIVLPELHDSAFSFDSRIESWAFELPLFLLGLSF